MPQLIQASAVRQVKVSSRSARRSEKPEMTAPMMPVPKRYLPMRSTLHIRPSLSTPDSPPRGATNLEGPASAIVKELACRKLISSSLPIASLWTETTTEDGGALPEDS